MSEDNSETYLESLQTKEADFHAMVGRCIAAWAVVDEVLFRIFRRCVGHYKISAIIYYRAPGLEVRIGLTEECVRALLPKPWPRKTGTHQHDSRKYWDSAIKGCRELLEIRRRIAHHPVRINVKSIFDEELPKEAELAWYEIYESTHELKRERPSKRLTRKDLEKHLSDVTKAVERLQHFHENMQPERQQ